VGSLRRRLGAIYGGRHLRTTLLLATASAAAGALTGAVGIGTAGARPHQDLVPSHQQTKSPKPRHHATTAPPAVTTTHLTPRRSSSPTPTLTPKPTHTVTPTPTASTTPTAPPTSSPASPPANSATSPAG
jgi:hypothetical protein